MKAHYVIFMFVFIALKGFAQYPGNVSSNLRSWHKANAGTTITGSGVSSWTDQSGNGLTAVQATDARRPPLTSNVFNFNPALTFDGDDNYLTLSDVMLTSATGITMFAVADLTAGSGSDSWGTIMQGQASSAWTGGGYGLGAMNSGNTSFGFWVRDYDTKFVSSSTSLSTGCILTGVWNTSSNATIEYKHNGTSQGTDSYTAGSVGDAGNTTIGGAPTTNYNYDGRIAELIVYNAGLSTANINKIESYLAMKYGITKAGDYVSSVGTSTVVWNSTTNSAYHYDVTVIGRDDNSVLDQRKSESVNSDNVIIIDKGGAFGADQTFLAWGNNNASIASWTTTENPADLGVKNIKRITREWKVATTGTPGAVTVSIDNTSLPSLPSNYHTYVLLVDADGNFASGATMYPMSLSSGSVYNANSSITLANGNYFTVGIVHNATKQTGNFGTVGTWAAGVAPVTLEEAIVMNTHTVTLTANQTTGSALITSGGKLDLGAYKLTIDSATITNNGTFAASTGTVEYSAAFNQNVAALSYYGLSTSGSGTKTLVGNATVTGTLVINLGSGTSSLTHSATVNPSLAITGSAFINQPTSNATSSWNINAGTASVGGNVSFPGYANNPNRIGQVTVTTGSLGIAGTLSFSNNNQSPTNEVFQVTSSGVVTIGADVSQVDGTISAAGTATLNFNGTTTRSYSFGGGNTPILTTNSGTTLTFAKGMRSTTTALTLHAASNIIFTGDGSITPASALKMGNVEIASTKTVTAAGSYSVAGNFTNNGTYAPATYTLSFTGSSAQSIGGSTATTFYGLTINNSSSTGVTLGQPTTVSNALTLTDGYVYTDATNLLILNDGVTCSAGSATTFVDGPMKKIGNDAFVFPLGDDASTDVWARLAISAPSSATDAFTAQYIYANPDASYSVSSLTTSIDNVSSKEYWLLDRTVGTSSVTIGLYWEDATAHGINNCSDLTVAHWNGSTWIEEPATAVGTCSGTGTGVVTTTATVGSFSPFTFGSHSTSVNPLPIELLEFTAKLNTDAVDVSWSTATETNNDYFLIEKSKDGINFEPTIKVKGAGTSKSYRQYKIMDGSPFSGISYYRLKQVDFDGKGSYSEIVSVDYANKRFNVYPNPVKSGQKLHIDGEDKSSTTVMVYDLLGNTCVYKDLPLSDGVLVIEALDLSAGTYFLFTESTKHWFKLVVE